MIVHEVNEDRSVWILYDFFDASSYEKMGAAARSWSGPVEVEVVCPTHLVLILRPGVGATSGAA